VNPMFSNIWQKEKNMLQPAARCIRVHVRACECWSYACPASTCTTAFLRSKARLQCTSRASTAVAKLSIRGKFTSPCAPIRAKGGCLLHAWSGTTLQAQQHRST
jgi:hypothetical protein